MSNNRGDCAIEYFRISWSITCRQLLDVAACGGIGDLRVGNFGDGLINAVDPLTGAYKGTLADCNGQPLSIAGLSRLTFSNDSNNQPANSLFYMAGPNEEADGLYGSIDTGA